MPHLILFEKRDVQPGRQYLLVLTRLGVSGCYGLSNEYGVIPEATEEVLRRIRKVIYGLEREPLATEAMPLRDAIEYAAGVMDETAKSLTEYARRSDEQLWEYRERLEFSSAAEMMESPDYVFRHLSGDRRVLAAIVEGDLELRTNEGRWGSLTPHAPYSSLVPSLPRRANLGWGLPEATEAISTLHSCRFYTTWLRINAFHFDKVLLAERGMDTPRGRWKIRMYVKTEPGPVGLPTRREAEP